MRITADTNLLVRMATRDDPVQAQAAFNILTAAESIFVPLPVILEFAWVLQSVYKYERGDVTEALIALIDSENVVTDTQAVETGLRVLAAGGDFADGVIASAGAAMGAEIFVSFDRRAVKRIAETGLSARYASELA